MPCPYKDNMLTRPEGPTYGNHSTIIDIGSSQTISKLDLNPILRYGKLYIFINEYNLLQLFWFIGGERIQKLTAKRAGINVEN
jgi:hypothetical protein